MYWLAGKTLEHHHSGVLNSPYLHNGLMNFASHVSVRAISMYTKCHNQSQLFVTKVFIDFVLVCFHLCWWRYQL